MEVAMIGVLLGLGILALGAALILGMDYLDRKWTDEEQTSEYWKYYNSDLL